MTPVTRQPADAFRFPDGFLWGAATSAHQVEGNNTLNDWWAWEQQGRVPVASGLACDHYRRFREDFDLARDLGHNAHRLSLEWSRIEPEEGRFDDAALTHYREVLEALRARRIEPLVTLQHFTIPRWLAEQGGWENEATERLYVRYVRRVVDAYGDLVRWWITFNEPVVQVFKGWIVGQWPPGRTGDYPRALQVVRRLLRSHVLAYHEIHTRRPDAMVSVAKHCLALRPNNPRNPFDWLSTRGRGYLFNELFLDSLHTGRLALPGQFFEHLPMGRTLDFIGANYYTRDFVRNTGFGLPGLVGTSATLDNPRHVGKRNDLGWEIYPEGLGHFLRTFRRYQVPIVITENGIPTSDEDDRWSFIFLHLWQVMRAMEAGVPVAGYLYWSLLDNFEWADGYDAKFGLVGVNFATQQRIVRPSARWLAEVTARSSL
ncbi:MAG: glycoside hydrolase family 1 protein [Candidatus Eisenbacteria bacterium]|uniref:Glycoside hydrolase family 1 protein n=1 Tax=Eiseniibacteriota bacterium TaxID=2212470 RepID=A0A849SEL0_UNCEI|nr:glycoside hydrolase family 1 protein [Candidatus Eisenbacteria bacterium]